MALAEKARISWNFNGQLLTRNAVGLRVTPNQNLQLRNTLGHARKALVAKRANDPRAVRYHMLELTFLGMDHQFVQLVEEQLYYARDPFRVKVYQLDYHDKTGITNPAEGATMLPSGYPTPGSYTVWFAPHRGISNDASEAPVIYVNGVIKSTGITWDYDEGKVTFDTAYNSATTTVKVYYVWKPWVKINRWEPNPEVGKTRGYYRYSPVLTLEEVGKETLVTTAEDPGNYPADGDIADDFLRADNAVVGTTPIGTKTWREHSGDPQIKSNQLYAAADGSRALVTVNNNVWEAKMSLYKAAGAGGVSPALLFWWDPATSNRMLVRHVSPNTWEAYRQPFGSGAVLIDSGAGAWTEPMQLRAVSNHPTMTIFANEVQVLNFTDATYNGLEVGIELQTTNQAADNFVFYYK